MMRIKRTNTMQDEDERKLDTVCEEWAKKHPTRAPFMICVARIVEAQFETISRTWAVMAFYAIGNVAKPSMKRLRDVFWKWRPVLETVKEWDVNYRLTRHISEPHRHKKQAIMWAAITAIAMQMPNLRIVRVSQGEDFDAITDICQWIALTTGTPVRFCVRLVTVPFAYIQWDQPPITDHTRQWRAPFLISTLTTLGVL